MQIFIAQEFHDIAPPVDYTLLKPWVVFCIAAAALAVIGFIAWLIVRWRNRPRPEESPRTRALNELRRIEPEIETLPAYQFSIRVSDVLRRYVSEQYHLPVTRQTSVEFLSALTAGSPFSEHETSLLTDFLDRCDMIKFARYAATAADSRLLLDEATSFVKGGQLAPA
jgi:hypothetical protein